MRDGSFQFKPGLTRKIQVDIPKPTHGSQRQRLTIARDQIVQEVMRMILEVIFEPTFSNHSHGFRPNPWGSHTALREVKSQFGAATTIIEGQLDLSKGFSFDHEILIELVKRKVSDTRFIQLI